MSTGVTIHDVTRAYLEPATIETFADGEKYEVLRLKIEVENGEDWEMVLFGVTSKKGADYVPVAPHIETKMQDERKRRQK